MNEPPDEADAYAAWRAAAAHVDRYELADARRVLAPYVVRDDLAAWIRGRILLEWAWLMAAAQRNTEAAESFDRTIALATSAGLPDLHAEALLEAGILARNEGRLDDADRLSNDCATIAATQESWLRVAQALAQRVSIAHLRHRYLDATRLLAELDAVIERCPSSDQASQLRADFCRHAAASARIATDFDRARTLLNEARERYEALGRRIGVANVDRELGAVLEQFGDDQAVGEAYGRAFAAYLRAGRRLGAAHVARRLGQRRLLRVPEDPDAAAYTRRRLVQALRLGGGEPANRADCELLLARLDRLTGDLDAAEVRLSAIAFDESPDAARDVSEVNLERGMLARARGDRVSAIEFLHQAVLPLDGDTDPTAASIAHFQLAYELCLDDQVERAEQHAVAAFRLAENAGRRLRDSSDRESYYRDQRQAYILAMHCAARVGDGPTAFAVAASARAEALSAFLRSGANLSSDLRELVETIAVARATSGGDAEVADLYRRLERLTSTELRRSVAGERASLAETLAALPPSGHALMVDVLEEEDTICSRVWLAPDGTPRVDEVVLPETVRRWLDRYRAGEPELAALPQDEGLAALGAAIIPPGLADVLGSGAEPPLVVSTGGLLGPVPVAAIRIGGRYLAELARIVLVPAIDLWTAIRTRPRRPGAGITAYLDPDLPGTRREKARLEEAFPQARLLRRDEVRASLADAGDRSAVVLSVHGSTAKGLGQALMLAPDDPLTAAELLTCRLPESVLMPACWVGRVDLRAAVEPLTLPTAALLAGARWVLAGTVDIASTSTASLLGAFYQRLAAGRAPADALRDVQRDYLARRGSMPPGTWAGLAIIGDGFGRGAAVNP